MKRYLMASVAAFTMLAACHSAQQHAPAGGYLLNGKVIGADTGWIYLQHADSSSSVIDSARIQNNTFSFTGKLNAPSFAYLWVGNMERGKYLSFFLTDTGLNIEFYGDSASKSKVSPTSPEQNTYEEYSKLMLPNSTKMKELIEIAGKLSAKVQSEDRKKEIYDSLGKEYMQLEKANTSLMETFVKSHTGSVVSAWAVATSSLMYAPDLLNLKMLYSEFQPSAKSNPYAVRIKRMIDVSERIAIGSMAPDFTADDTANKPVSLSGFKNKYVLLDFWASWCNPCRQENPNVVDAFNKFRNKNFTILQVSLDDNRENWVKAIHDDRLDWNHVSDLKGWSSKIAMLYAIQSIPSNFLIDPSGKIIAHNLRGGALQDTLAHILGN
jgi:peroxiredoxin